MLEYDSKGLNLKSVVVKKAVVLGTAHNIGELKGHSWLIFLSRQKVQCLLERRIADLHSIIAVLPAD